MFLYKKVVSDIANNDVINDSNYVSEEERDPR